VPQHHHEDPPPIAQLSYPIQQRIKCYNHMEILAYNVCAYMYT
jgi:hypothetical protein